MASVPGGDENQLDPNLRAPLVHLYFLEPAIKAYEEVFKGRDPEYAARLLALIRRMTGFVIGSMYGGDTNAAGLYRPRQIPFFYDVRQPLDAPREGQIPHLLMSANAAAFLFGETSEVRYRDYARAGFQDYVRYFSIVPGDTYANASLRSPTAYNSTVFAETESKIQGWSGRYVQYILAAEGLTAPLPTAGRRRSVRP